MRKFFLASVGEIKERHWAVGSYGRSAESRRLLRIPNEFETAGLTLHLLWGCHTLRQLNDDAG